MAENVLHADLNLPESTRPRILKVPDVPGKSCCSGTRVPVLLAVLVVIILIMVIPLYLTLTDGATAGSQQNSTKLPPSHEGAPGKRCCSRTRVAVLVTGIILLLLIIVCQILPCKSRCYSRRLLAVLAAVLVVAVLALTLCWTLLYGATAGSQEHSTTTIPEEALGCPPKWEKHGRKCYFFSPETKVKDWNASRDECAAMGSELVIIDSREELGASKMEKSILWSCGKRITFAHDQDIITTYWVSDCLKRRRSGSGSTTWNMTQPCELIPASPCHAMSGENPKAEQRAESPREIRDCGLGEADSLRSRCFSTCLCQGKGAFQCHGTQACPIRVAGEDAAVVLLGKEGSDWMQFPGERKEPGGKDKREGDVSTIGWRGPKQGRSLDGKALPRNFCGDVGNKSEEWEGDSSKAVPDPSDTA
ncbi:uncharacterized protein [Aphelocoma coerulescens]|uniref:uncharacterized protein isoform X2 n=1 Tax=Aphelocoma coerulescens TaxID=39617 RepID=UPI003604E119